MLPWRLGSLLITFAAYILDRCLPIALQKKRCFATLFLSLGFLFQGVRLNTSGFKASRLQGFKASRLLVSRSCTLKIAAVFYFSSISNLLGTPSHLAASAMAGLTSVRLGQCSASSALSWIKIRCSPTNSSS